MKIQPYVQKLQSSDVFKKFIKENSESFVVAGFFVLDYETGMNIHQIDYYIPSKKQVAAFNLDGEVEFRLLDLMHKDKKPEKLDLKTKVDLDAIKGILEDEMKNRNMTESIKKCVAVIQMIEGKKLWVINCVLSGMEILKAHVDDNSRSILKMERTSMLEYIKKVPQALPQASPKSSKESIQKQIEQLDKLKQQLENEKKQMESKGNDAPEEGFEEVEQKGK